MPAGANYNKKIQRLKKFPHSSLWKSSEQKQGIKAKHTPRAQVLPQISSPPAVPHRLRPDEFR